LLFLFRLCFCLGLLVCVFLGFELFGRFIWRQVLLAEILRRRVVERLFCSGWLLLWGFLLFISSRLFFFLPRSLLVFGRPIHQGDADDAVIIGRKFPTSVVL